jgi:hypothetical protein
LESGALSDPAFPAFAAKVVPLMHITTHIPGHPYDDLLKRNGGGGFPTLQFLDADGKVLAGVSVRTVETFEDALDALSRIDEARARAADGDPVAEADVLLMEHVLGKVEVSLFRERAAMLKGPTKEQRARIDQTLVDLAIWEAVRFRDEQAKAERLLGLLRDGKRPSDAPRYAVNFWSILGRWGSVTADAALLREVSAGIREQLGAESGMVSFADSLDRTAARVEHRDTLMHRLAAGESALTAEVLLLDAELGLVSIEAYRERMPAALEVADAEQAEAVRQGEVDLEVVALWTGFSRREFTPAVAGSRLFEILCGDGRRPSETPTRQALPIAARWAAENLVTLDKPRVRVLVALLEEHLSGYAYWDELRERLQAHVAAGEEAGGNGGD